MPIITDIAQQKKHQNRYSIFVDGSYSFSLGDLELSTSGLRIGQELTEEELNTLQAGAVRSKYFDKAIGFISYRPRTRKEVQDYLNKKSCEEGEVEPILERLQEIGLIADDQFATSWVSSRQSLKPRSKRRLQQELRQKGLDAVVIEETLAGVSAEDEQEAIKAIIKKKTAQPKFRDERKLVTYLTGQGFGYSQVRQVLDEVDLSAASNEESVS